jgi:O-antigen/teichoic acid export membrane protein
VLGFALTVIIGRGLGPTGAGQFFTISAIFFVLSNAMELGADTGLLWALPRLRAHRRFADLRPTLTAALNPVWIASGLTGLAIFVSAPWLSGVFFDGAEAAQGTTLLRIIAPALILASPMTVALAGTRGLGSVVPFTLITNIAVPLARPAFILAALAAGLGAASALEAVVAAWSLPIALGCAGAFVVLMRALAATEERVARTGRRIRRRRARSLLSGEFWTYSRPRAVAALLEIALVWTDVLLLTAIAGPRLAGIYAAASRFVTTGTLAEAAMRVALSPRLSELLALGNVQVAGRLIGTASVWITAISWPLYLVLATFSPYVLQLFGAEFAEGATALTVLAVAMAISMTAGNVQTVLLMSGRSAWQLGNKAAALTVDIVLCLVLIPRLGMVGAACAWASAILLDTALALVQVRYGIGVRSYVVRRGKRGRSDWRAELAALTSSMSPLAPQRAAEAERGQHRSDEAALAVISRRGMALLPVGFAAAVLFGGLGLLLRLTMGPSATGFAVYVGVSVPLYAAALWRLRALLDLDTILAGLRKRAGGGTKAAAGPSGERPDAPSPQPGRGRKRDQRSGRRRG